MAHWFGDTYSGGNYRGRSYCITYILTLIEEPSTQHWDQLQLSKEKIKQIQDIFKAKRQRGLSKLLSELPRRHAVEAIQRALSKLLDELPQQPAELALRPAELAKQRAILKLLSLLAQRRVIEIKKYNHY